MGTPDISDQPAAPAPTRGRGGWVRQALTVLVVALLVFAAAVWFVDPLGRLREAVFGTPDRPSAGDTTLLEIRRTSQLRAATGTFSVPVFFGVEEQSGLRRFVPDIIDGNSGVAIYQGSVDALIELSGLTQDDIEADEEASTLTITVPEPVLTDPNVDEARSSVISQSRGIGTRMRDFFAANPLQGREALDQVAVAALTDAAEQSGLMDTARSNGRDFLTALGRQVGFETVVVDFE